MASNFTNHTNKATSNRIEELSSLLDLEDTALLKLFSELPIDTRVKTMKEIKTLLIECDSAELMSIDEIILDQIKYSVSEAVKGSRKGKQ